jgi:hypothetical protein
MKDQLVPVVELHHNGTASSPLFVPLHELDSMVGELCDDFDFGLGQYEVENKHELGSLKVNLKAPKLTLPKISVSAAGIFKPLLPALKATAKAPVRAAVKAVTQQKKKPIVLARKKPNQANSASNQNLASIFKALQQQGKIVNLMHTKHQVTSEHNKRMDQDGFRETVLDLLHKIEKQCAGDQSGNYFARWNKLKNVTGVAIHER